MKILLLRIWQIAKKSLVLALALAVFLSANMAAATPGPTAGGAGAGYGAGSGAQFNLFDILSDSSDEFISEAVKVINENWSDNYFSAITMTVGETELSIDGDDVDIAYPAVVDGGELMLPLIDVAEVVGATVVTENDDDAFIIINDGESKQLEAPYFDAEKIEDADYASANGVGANGVSQGGANDAGANGASVNGARANGAGQNEIDAHGRSGGANGAPGSTRNGVQGNATEAARNGAQGNSQGNAQGNTQENTQNYEQGNSQGNARRGAGRRKLPIYRASEVEAALDLDISLSGDHILITKPYQLKQIILYVKGGKNLADDLGASASVTNGKGAYFLQYPTDEAARAAFEAFESDGAIEYATVNQIVKSEALPDRWGAERIAADRFAGYLGQNNKLSNQISVAVVDTGVDSSHPFLAGRTVPGYNFDDDSSDTRDVYGHGTHVSGIVADNTPPNVKIMPIKSLTDQGTYYDHFVVSAGIRYAADHGAKVINLSIGGYCTQSNCLHLQAIDYAASKGALSVAAAGNYAADAAVYCPAKSPSALTVSAIDRYDALASFNNYGTPLDLAAPGVGVTSCYPGNRYQSLSGTSMAAPHASAAAAMLMLEYPSYTPAQIKAKLKSLTLPFPNQPAANYGAGILDLNLFFNNPPANKTAPPDIICADLLNGKQIKFSDATPGATIYFTADGKEPNKNSWPGNGITLSHFYPGTYTYKAMATAAGMEDSDVVTYVFSFDRAAPPSADPPPGTVPAGTSVKLVPSSPNATIYYTIDGSYPDVSKTRYTQPIPVNGKTLIAAAAYEYGKAMSDVKTFSYDVGATEKVAKPSIISADLFNGLQLSFNTATSGAKIYYTTNGATPTRASLSGDGVKFSFTSPCYITIKVIAVKDGMADSDVATYVVDLSRVGAPRANPPAGQVPAGTSVSLSSDTYGASIYYTTDGSAPDMSKTLYRQPIQINGATVINAIAYRPGSPASDVQTFRYTVFAEPVEPPSASPATGFVQYGYQVKMTTPTQGASIYYTTDGTMPTVNSRLYTSPVSVYGAVIFAARAYKNGVYSEPAVFAYLVDATKVNGSEDANPDYAAVEEERAYENPGANRGVEITDDIYDNMINENDGNSEDDEYNKYDENSEDDEYNKYGEYNEDSIKIDKNTEIINDSAEVIYDNIGVIIEGDLRGSLTESEYKDFPQAGDLTEAPSPSPIPDENPRADDRIAEAPYALPSKPDNTAETDESD